MTDRQVNAKVIYPTLGYTVLSTGQDIRRDENVEVIVHVGHGAHGRAWFEFYDIKTEGEVRCYVWGLRNHTQSRKRNPD